MTQIIEIIVSATGQTRVQTTGFVGSSCREASKFLEQALGTQEREQLTGEFYQQVAQQQPLQEGA